MATLTRWAPFESVASFDRFSKIMEDFFGANDENRMSFMPAVDVTENEKSITFHAELPGIPQENVEVELVGDRLTIKGRREFNREEKKENYVNIERSYGSFQRTFTLDFPVKEKDIEATFKDGVLTVIVPKAATAPTKKVPIKKS